jgi:hypothetical protein
VSQQHVEQVIGRLATDQALRRSFALQPEATLSELIAAGLRLTPVECQALLAIDLEALQRLADRLDPRIQRVSFGAGNP